MNQQLKRIDIEKVLFFDCETVRKSEILDPNSKEFKLYQKKIRNKETDELPTEDETILDYKKRAPLRLGYSKICTIGLGFVRSGEVFIKALTGPEEDILQEFFSIASQFDYLSGFNILGYDLPHCTLNASKYFDYTSILPDRFVTSGKKTWNLDKVIDLMEVVKGTSYVNMSFDEALYHFNLDSSKTDIDGSQVSETWYNGEEERVIEYVKQDVFQTVNLFAKLQFKEKYENFIDRSSIKTKKVELPPLKKLHETDYLSDEIKEQLRGLFKKKRLTKKDKEFIQDVLEHVYIKTSFMKEDTPEVRETKIAEIKELLKEI